MSAPSGGRVAAWALDAVIVLASIAGLWLVWTQSVEFGSERGQWVFRYVDTVDGRFVALACAAGLMVAALHEVGRRWVDTGPVLTVAATLAGGVGVQLALRSLYPHAMGELVVSDVVNSFYEAAGRVGPLELLADFERQAMRLPLHARVNMPGKVVFYQALRAITSDPDALALAVVCTSSAAGLLLYAVVARVFASRALGLDALTLWLLVPAKASFHPVLNVVSPLPALLVVWCFVRLVQGAGAWSALALGTSAYLTAFFDPLAFWLALPFAALAVRGRSRPVRVAALLGLAVLAFLATHFAVRATTGFDAWRRFLAMVEFARVFNVRWNRPYDLWVWANVKDVALAVGPAVAAACVAAGLLALWTTGRTIATAAWRRLDDPGPLLALATVGAVGALVALGLNRGEVARLWIPVFVPVQAAAAWCTGESHAASRALVIAATVAYAAVTVATVGYALP